MAWGQILPGSETRPHAHLRSGRNAHRLSNGRTSSRPAFPDWISVAAVQQQPDGLRLIGGFTRFNCFCNFRVVAPAESDRGNTTVLTNTLQTARLHVGS